MFSIDSQGSWIVVRPVGDLDLAAADEFRAIAFQALSRARPPRVAIDFSEVTFLDSSGVSVIARVFKESKWLGGRLVLVGLSDRIRLVLEMTGVDKVVDIRDDLTAEECSPSGGFSKA